MGRWEADGSSNVGDFEPPALRHREASNSTGGPISGRAEINVQGLDQVSGPISLT